jgi:hypothetical protein
MIVDDIDSRYTEPAHPAIEVARCEESLHVFATKAQDGHAALYRIKVYPIKVWERLEVSFRD